MRKGFFAVLVLVTMLSTQAFARSAGSGLLLTLNGFMENAETSQGGTTTEHKRMMYDLKFGNTWGNGFYLGALYFSESDKTESTSSDGSGYGASAGYMGASGFFIQGHYILSAKMATLAEGSGVQVDFGYLTDVSPAVVVGVELRYRSIEYKEENGVKIDGFKITRLLPMLTVGFTF